MIQIVPPPISNSPPRKRRKQTRSMSSGGGETTEGGGGGGGGGGIPIRVLRSPSHESVTTDLSLLSLSSYGSDFSRGAQTTFRSGSRSRPHSNIVIDGTGESGTAACAVEARGASPHAGLRGSRNSLLQVPGEFYGRRPIPEILFEEESDVIRSCGALSAALGLRRSFSTSDIVGTVLSETDGYLRPSVSETYLQGGSSPARCGSGLDWGPGRLEYASRSCSTWVAVGDMASTSQLPSPQGGHPTPVGDSPAITAADLVRSVNKKVRQSYIKQRLLTTYKALERVAQSELALNIEDPAARISKAQLSRELLRMLRKDGDSQGLGLKGTARTLNLTVRDVERERGKPLTKYERNMMIFNWLHTLEDNSFDRLA